jgi:hypothetical protein
MARPVAFLLAAALLALAVPRAIAHLALAPGLQATTSLQSGERVTRAGFERAVRAHRAALDWVENGRWHTRVGILLVMYADFLEPPEATSLLAEGVEEIFHGLAGEPADTHGWLTLARVFYEARQPLQAAGALEWTVRTGRYDPDNATPRVVLGLELWEFLSEPARESLAADLLAWFRRAPRDVVTLAVAADRLDLVSAILARDERAGQHFARLLADLEKEAAARTQPAGGGS